MFREMRRRKQLLSMEESRKILERQTAGVLAVTGDDGYPYAVPVSYVYMQGKVYLHSALQGHKIDGILRESKVSLCVIDRDQIVPEKFTTYFRSVILFGRAKIVAEEQEKWRALELLGDQYAPGNQAGCRAEIEQQLRHTCVIEIAIEHMTGKEAIELVREKETGF